jgi:hypothetical protein
VTRASETATSSLANTHRRPPTDTHRRRDSASAGPAVLDRLRLGPTFLRPDFRLARRPLWRRSPPANSGNLISIRETLHRGNGERFDSPWDLIERMSAVLSREIGRQGVGRKPDGWRDVAYGLLSVVVEGLDKEGAEEQRRKEVQGRRKEMGRLFREAVERKWKRESRKARRGAQDALSRMEGRVEKSRSPKPKH